MTGNNEKPKGTARRLVDKFTVNDWDVARSVMKGLTNAGYDVEIETEFTDMVPGITMNNRRQTITVYRREE